MIIDFNLFESERGIRKGDYVICHDNYFKKEDRDLLNKFIDNQIGRYIGYDRTADYRYMVEYENVPSELDRIFNNNILWMNKSEILFFSKNKEELETIINSKKYNL